MSNVHNYEEIKDLLFGKGRTRLLYPEDDDLDEIISKVLQKVEIEVKQETVYEIMRGQHGHDEHVIVKSIQEDVDTLTTNKSQ